MSNSQDKFMNTFDVIPEKMKAKDDEKHSDD